MKQEGLIFSSTRHYSPVLHCPVGDKVYPRIFYETSFIKASLMSVLVLKAPPTACLAMYHHSSIHTTGRRDAALKQFNFTQFIFLAADAMRHTAHDQAFYTAPADHRFGTCNSYISRVYSQFICAYCN